MININGVTISEGVQIEKVNDAKNEYKVELSVKGKNNFNLYNALLKQSKVKIEMPEAEVEFDGTIKNLVSSYVGFLDENTNVSFSFLIKEFTGENEWNLYRGLFETAISNWVRTRALTKILVDNGLTTNEDYVKLIEEIDESDFEEMRNYILKGE